MEGKIMIVKGREVKVNMQRRHLELIASVINNINTNKSVDRNEVAVMFADVLKRERVNESFDIARFVKACTEDK
jgi:Mn-containing catalase